MIKNFKKNSLKAVPKKENAKKKRKYKKKVVDKAPKLDLNEE